MRRKTKEIFIGKVRIGGDAPIVVQSMTNADTADVKATVKQIKALEKSGCEIVRVAVPDPRAAKALPQILSNIKIPLIADIHFDYRLALSAIFSGVQGLRINPGNIGNRKKIEAVVNAAVQNKIPIRIGVNAGSLEKDLLEKHQGVSAQGMVESALRHIRILEEMGFFAIKVSLKASNVLETVEAYRLLAKETDYPFHIGITEAGTLLTGTIRSAVGLGILLNEGIGDTLRVSLSSNPVDEIYVAYEILKSLNLRKKGMTLISCPTCSRQEIDVISIAKKVEKKIRNLDREGEIAVMGCAVNGPGEAKRADLGVAGGQGIGVLFRQGKIIRKIPKEKIIEEFLKEISKL